MDEKKRQPPPGARTLRQEARANVARDLCEHLDEKLKEYQDPNGMMAKVNRIMHRHLEQWV